MAKISKADFNLVKKYISINFLQLSSDGSSTKKSNMVGAKLCDSQKDFAGSTKLKEEFSKSRPFLLCPASYKGLSIENAENALSTKRTAVEISWCDKSKNQLCQF